MKEQAMDRLHVGTMGWSYEFWVGKLYPEGTTSTDFLSQYSNRFNSVELDNTFYRIPSVNTVENWRTQASEGFLFAAKFPRKITHVRMLQDCRSETNAFLEHISHLEDKLGPLLIQLPPNFKLEMLDSLREFVNNLPKNHRFAVEVRNKKMLDENLYAILKENNVALTWVDHPFMPNIDVKTADFVYIRWEGDRRKVNGTLGRTETDKTEGIKKWADRIKGLQASSIDLFGYFSKYYSGYPPADADQLLAYVMR